MELSKILIIDFGSQYAHLIARRIRQLGVYSEIIHNEEFSAEKHNGYSGIILSGGPMSVYAENSPKISKEIFDLKVPLLGICYGLQLISQMLGGKVSPGKVKEYGLAEVDVIKTEGILKGLSSRETVWMSHGDSVSEAPKGFDIIASTPDCPIAAIQDKEKKIYGIQFHPEVSHTKNGLKILENFIDICNCKRQWSVSNYFEDIKKEVIKTAEGKKVFMLVSGGVDSTVCFALLNKVLGEERVYGLHIDNGFMRKDESKKVEDYFRKSNKNFHIRDASEEFLDALKDAYEPEQKRKIIGQLFLDIQQKEVQKLGLNEDEWLLGQGTIYPDTIESKGTKNADLIKTHHNRIDKIREMIEQGKVIEPLKQLYKDEVRELGNFIGIDKEMIDRHPFPGPGLAIRCLCSDEEKDVPEVNEINGVKGTMLPIKSVGVQGDERTYRKSFLIRSDKSWKELEKLSTSITNSNKEVNRVLLQLFPEKAKLKMIKAGLTKERLDLLREIDDRVTRFCKDNNIYDEIWQFPVILLPMTDAGKQCIILRPITSIDAMTASFYKFNNTLLRQLILELTKDSLIGGVFYDITNKPPATIEWE